MIEIQPGDTCVQITPRGRVYWFIASRVTPKCVFFRRGGRSEGREERSTVCFASADKDKAERLRDALESRSDAMAKAKREARDKCDLACAPHLEAKDAAFEESEKVFADECEQLISAASK